MAALSSGDPSHHGTPEEIDKVSQEKLEEGGGHWYFSKKEIEENSPSRQDGIDLKKESNLRWRYSRFIQDLGKALKVPQVAIATAIVFCHRFFLRQSHAKNDCKIISTVCLFLACKVEDSPRPLRVFIQELESLLQKKEVNEELEKLIWVRERVVLTTLGFDLIVHHPYKPLGKAIKKFKVPQNPFAQVAWNLINDGLQTSLCLQFKPHQIAAGAFFLAGTINKLKLPSGYKSAWLKEFDVTPEQLKEISGQMWVSYNRNRASRSQASKAEGSGARSERPPPLIGPANKSTDGNEGHDEDDDQEGNSIKTQDTIQVKDECDHGKNLSSRERTAAQLSQEAYEKLDVEKIKVTIKRRKALRGNIGFKVDPTDELEKELEDVELPGKSEKIEEERKQNSSSCGDELEEGEVGPYDDDDMGSLSPTSTGNSNPGEPLDMPMEGDQPSDSA